MGISQKFETVTQPSKSWEFTQTKLKKKMFITFQFLIANIWNQIWYQPTDDRIKKMQYLCAIEYYEVAKRIKSCLLHQSGQT